MSKLLKIIVHFTTYIFSLSIGAIIGAFCLYFLVGSLYVSSHPNQVMDSYECAHGGVLGLATLLGGAICGVGLSGYVVSKILYSSEGAVGGSAYNLRIMEWIDSFTRKLRGATHLICAGGVIIGFSAFSSPQIFMLTFLLGMSFTLIGFVRFIWAHFARARMINKA